MVELSGHGDSGHPPKKMEPTIKMRLGHIKLQHSIIIKGSDATSLTQSLIEWFQEHGRQLPRPSAQSVEDRHKQHHNWQLSVSPANRAKYLQLRKTGQFIPLLLSWELHFSMVCCLKITTTPTQNEPSTVLDLSFIIFKAFFLLSQRGSRRLFC